MRIPALLVAVAALSQPVAAQAADASCIPPKQAEALVGYALPSVISGTTKRCDAQLDGKSFLKTGGPGLAQKYAARKTATWPAAKAAFLTLSKGKDDASKVLSQLPDNSLREMLDVIMEGMVVQEIPVAECGKIDNFVRLLAPLPPENMAELIALTVAMATDKKTAKPGKFAICKA